MDKRNHPRIAVKNLSAVASDGVGFSQGVISDVSRAGICVTGLVKRLDRKVEKMAIVVSGPGHSFEMNVRPKWSTYNGENKTIGAEILNPPWDWTEFVMKFEPRVHDDIWAQNPVPLR